MSQNFMKEVKQMKQTLKRVKNMLSVMAILMVASRVCGASSAEATKSVRLILPSRPGLVVENTGKVFTRQVQQRCEAKVVTGGKVPLTVELAVEKGIGAEGYRIEEHLVGLADLQQVFNELRIAIVPCEFDSNVVVMYSFLVKELNQRPNHAENG